MQHPRRHARTQGAPFPGHGKQALSQIASYLSKETETTMVNIAHNLLAAVRHLLMLSLGPAISRRLHCKPSLAAPLAGGVQIPDGHSFDLHNTRHCFRQWLVNKAGGTQKQYEREPATTGTRVRHPRRGRGSNSCVSLIHHRGFLTPTAD